MADEFGTYIQCEIETIKLVFKGSIEAAALAARLFRALCDFENKMSERKHEKGSLESITKYAEAHSSVLQGIEIREEDYEEVIRNAKKQGLHFWRSIDPDPLDKMTPIMISSHEVAAWKQIQNAVIERRLKADKVSLRENERAIAEIRGAITSLSEEEKGTDKEKQLRVKLENLKQAHDEKMQWIEYDENLLNKPAGKTGYSLEEYLYRFKNTDAAENPELAMEEMKKGVEIGPKMTMKESLQPIRSREMMPDSKITFYVPETGSIVTRMFKVNEETNLVYSDYKIKTANGEIKEFTDYNITRAEWNKDVLPEILQYGGMLEGTRCRAFATEERLMAYLKYHNKIKDPVKERVSEKMEKNELVFSNAETRKKILEEYEESEKEVASAKVDKNIAEITIPQDRVMNRGGRLDIEISDQQHIRLSAVEIIPNEDNPGIVKLRLDEKSKATFVNADSEVSINPKEAKNIADEAFRAISDVRKSSKVKGSR